MEAADKLMGLQEPFGFAEDEITNLNTMNPSRNLKDLSDTELNHLAEKIANDHWWSKVENNSELIANPKKVTFTFRNYVCTPTPNGKPSCEGGKNSKTDLEIEANPYLRRLYHKLERTLGEEHIEGSGLEGTQGMYGLDRKSTRLNSSHIPLSRMPSSA